MSKPRPIDDSPLVATAAARLALAIAATEKEVPDCADLPGARGLLSRALDRRETGSDAHQLVRRLNTAAHSLPRPIFTLIGDF